MEWKKASERLPENSGKKYITRYPKLPNEYKFLKWSEIDAENDASYDIEWLDESPQPSPPEQGKEWNKPIDGVIHVPDELDPIINKVATQMRFHTISGKSEQETVADIVYICQKFFTQHHIK